MEVTETTSRTAAQLEECTAFLVAEAALLDDNRLTDWLELLTPDVDYRVPVRIVRERGGGSGFSTDAFFMKEDFGTLETRVTRLDNEFAWAESPPTRTRRFVANARLVEPGTGQGESEVRVLNNLAVYCYRGDSAAPVVLTAERQDTLRRAEDGSWKLARRLVLLASTVLGLQALSIFL
jgi:3-phenylpropionate/cinnamic acid dioxygenase small subunit